MSASEKGHGWALTSPKQEAATFAGGGGTGVSARRYEKGEFGGTAWFRKAAVERARES